MRIISFIPLILAVGALLLLCSGGSPTFAHEQPGVIRFGVYPYETARSVYSLYAPLAKRIEDKTGKKVELVSAPDQKIFTEKAAEGAYDLALVSPNAFFKIQAAGYHVIARGEPPFHGTVIVRSDSGITAPGQLRGKKIAAIGKYSYGGYLFFRQELAALGISPDRDVVFTLLDKVDSVILSVVNKQYEAGVIRADALNRPTFDQVRDKVRIISRSSEIPQFPFVVKDSVDPDTVRLIREVLTAITPEKMEDSTILKSLQIDRIVAAQDADYETFRQVIKQAEQ